MTRSCSITEYAQSWRPTAACSTWAQARDHGLTSAQLRHLSEEGANSSSSDVASTSTASCGGRWTRTGSRTACARRAVIRGLKRGFVVSHDSAAHEHELEILLPPDPHTHITRRGSTTAWSRYGVKHHYAGFKPEQVVGDRRARGARPRAYRGGHRSRARRAVRRDRVRRGHASWRDPRGAARGVRAHDQLAARPADQEGVEFADPGAQTAIETLGRLLVECARSRRDRDAVPVPPDRRSGALG